jgi:L-iditol 2-dehydrogenase
VSCGDYRRPGAFAEFVSVPSRIIHRLPDSLPFEDAALLEAVAVALHAVSLTAVDPGCTALVVGAGTIGLLLQQALRVAGCARVFVTDPDRTRLNLSQKLGASETIAENVVERINNLTDGTGVDLVVEAVGRTESIATSIDCVRKGGTVILVGNISPEVKIPLQKVVSRQLRLQGSCASAGEYPRAIELMSKGTIRVKPLITAVAPLAEGPQWFERLYAREPNLMKVVLTPGNPS